MHCRAAGRGGLTVSKLAIVVFVELLLSLLICSLDDKLVVEFGCCS
jgi:hypothetical protein